MSREIKITCENPEAMPILWENYAEKYNSLSNLMQISGLDPKLLREVIDAALKLYIAYSPAMERSLPNLKYYRMKEEERIMGERMEKVLVYKDCKDS